MLTPNSTLTELDAEDLARLKERVAAASANRATERAVARMAAYLREVTR